jgi:hypothetical protein
VVLGAATVDGNPLEVALELSFSSANSPASMRLASSTSCSAFSSETLPICFR